MKKLLPIIIMFNFFFVSCNNSQLSITSSDNIIVHFIDVGQGDSTLIQVNNINLLIDTGPKSSRKELISFLNSQNIDKIHYAIATHPHEDHIGSMAYIIDEYSVEKFFAPKIESSSKSFDVMLDALKRNSLKINVLKEGSQNISLGENTKVTVFSPLAPNYENINNYSPIVKIEYIDISFLFTGDAEKEVESQILNSNTKDLKSDIIKIGHHGSKTSSSKSFIDAVDPKVAILSYEENNSYGHPHSDVVSLLKDKKIKILSTSENETLSFFSDGKNLYSFDKYKYANKNALAFMLEHFCSPF